ncbi:MAG: transketolase, partial [Deltaproteobacteria bacterium]|nr:transketolase [Deltaproteobacteria bacterium]
ILRSLPALTVVAPGDLWEVAEATEAIINQPGTCYLRLDKSYASPSHKKDERFHLGKARIICEGQDLTFLVTGGVLAEVLEAKDRLLDDGICARVLSVHTIKPLDTEAIVSASRETGGIITVEEHTIHGGLGGAVAETILESGIYPKFFYRIGIRAAGFASVVGSQQFLRKTYALDSASIYTKALELLRFC